MQNKNFNFGEKAGTNNPLQPYANSILRNQFPDFVPLKGTRTALGIIQDIIKIRFTFCGAPLTTKAPFIIFHPTPLASEEIYPKILLLFLFVLHVTYIGINPNPFDGVR